MCSITLTGDVAQFPTFPIPQRIFLRHLVPFAVLIHVILVISRHHILYHHPSHLRSFTLNYHLFLSPWHLSNLFCFYTHSKLKTRVFHKCFFPFFVGYDWLGLDSLLIGFVSSFRYFIIFWSRDVMPNADKLFNCLIVCGHCVSLTENFQSVKQNFHYIWCHMITVVCRLIKRWPNKYCINSWSKCCRRLEAAMNEVTALSAAALWRMWVSGPRRLISKDHSHTSALRDSARSGQSRPTTVYAVATENYLLTL